MFVNFKAIAHMRSPIATIEPIILDSIISAAKAKEILSDEYYSNMKNTYGDVELVDKTLSTILDKKYDVFCTSIGYMDSREFVGSWSKRFDVKNSNLISFRTRGKKRIDVGGGYYKNYHMPIVLKGTDKITFYVRGDMKEVDRLLNTYIAYLGKKSSQGYGQIREWEFVEIEEDRSVWNNDKPARPIPVKHCTDYISSKMDNGEFIETNKHPIIPPYWRDERVECVMPEEV